CAGWGVCNELVGLGKPHGCCQTKVGVSSGLFPPQGSVAMPARRSLPLCAFALVLATSPQTLWGLPDDKPKGEQPAKEKDKADRELHVVGICEGFTESGGKIHGGKALVTVNRPGKQVTLVLLTSDPVTWEVTLGKDTKLEKVILGGGGRSVVKGLPEKV